MAVQAAAVCAALLGAWLLTWTERKAPEQQEALIGVMFILAACAGILLLAGNPHGGEHLKDLLVGQILWVNTHAAAVARGACRRCCWRRCALGWVERLGRFGFYGAFALAVTASVQLVGVYLVFSSLIIPALATRADRGQAATRDRLRPRRARLCARPGALGAARPAVRRGDRLGAGGLCVGLRGDPVELGERGRHRAIGTEALVSRNSRPKKNGPDAEASNPLI